MYTRKIRVNQKMAIFKELPVSTKPLLVILIVGVCCSALPYHAAMAQEEKGACPKPYIVSIFPRAAGPGDLVTIHGGKFGMKRGEVIFTQKVMAPQDVVFAPQVKAEIMSWTFRRIMVIVPKSVASGPVFVRVPCGSKSNERDFTLNK
jgi:hypothetical protein